MRSASRSAHPWGFTLVELLVVITIILLVSVATLPAVLPALGQRRVAEAARILQAGIVGGHDAAIHANAPRGFRLIPDPTLPTGTLGYNRIIPIEPAPDYSEGRVSIFSDTSQAISTAALNTNNWPVPGTSNAPVGFLILWQAVNSTSGYTNSPTSWYWNVRVGDRVQIGNNGRTYTIIGPQNIPYGNVNNPPNPDGFVNIGNPGTLPAADPEGKGTNPEYLFLVNGVDDDADGFIDPQWDGVDNNLNGLTDLINDTNEYEAEKWLSDVVTNPLISVPYNITRRPVPVQGAREVTLPGGTVIDATTVFGTAERSRLPVDLATNYVDVLIQPNGQVVPTTLYSAPSAYGIAAAFYHFWITDREDVHEPLFGINATTGAPTANPNTGGLNPPAVNVLPMPVGTLNYTNTTVLRGERRLVTLFTRSGNIVTNTIETFDVTDPGAPFYAAESGVREAK